MAEQDDEKTWPGWIGSRSSEPTVLRYCSLPPGNKQLSKQPLSSMSRLCDVELAGLAVPLAFSSQQPSGRQGQLAFVKGM